MTRARPVDALLAAVATLLALLPLTTLFEPNSFLQPSVVMIGVVAVTGVAGRVLVARRWPVVVAQVVTGFLTVVAMDGRGHLWHGLPTLDLLAAWRAVLVDAVRTIQSYTAPAPTTRGVILGVTLGVGVAAVLVDALAVTYRSPALAGLPLLAAYLISAANSGVGLPAVYFLLSASAWVLLVGRQGVASFRGWGTAIPLDAPERRLGDEALSLRFTSAGRRLALGCLVLAVVVPMALPHLPSRFLLSGLGRNPDGVGAGSSMRLSSTLDVGRSLGSRSQGAVLVYHSDAAVTEPLRVDVLTSYSNGLWTLPDAYPVGRQLPDPPDGTDRDVTRTTDQITVRDNTIDPPQLAAPYPVVGVSMGRLDWTATRSGTIHIAQRPSSYRIDYLTLSPTEAQLRAATFDSLDYGSIDGSDLDVDGGSIDTVERIVDRLVPRDADPITVARAIQNYLRGPTFTYTLHLAKTAPQDGGDPLLTFLRTRKGYCVQFATAMIMMARARGIPARMAIGFLPGHVQADGSYVVRASDAHAWPELYFTGIGWLRFEPTPGSRSGSAPIYSTAPLPGDTNTPASTQSASQAPSPTITPRVVNPQNDGGRATTPTPAAPLRLWEGVRGLPSWAWVGVLLLLGALSALVVPAAAALRRRRELATAVDDAERVEVEWQGLVARVGDLGVRPPPGATPRQAGRYLSTRAQLLREEDEVLSSVVSTVETARYAAPGTPVEDVTAPARQVLDAVRRSRPRRERLRARLLPGEGLEQLRSVGRRLLRAPRNAVARLRHPRR